MFEQFVSLMFLIPGTPADTWSAAGTPVNQAYTMQVRMEVRGRPGPGCSPQVLTLPPPNAGKLRFEDRGVRYEGTEMASGSLVLRSNGARPLTLTGDRASGGRWSAGNDGSCVGVWTPGR